ncbi:unnamed protein product [Toxocara canis]|uniref:Uncharacterized protein n=1 Tax=Toxocara canis TaxID=6265 RepID=A0A3P7IQ07_TOXCA|nr:unnamed protein product [Toxocara canis]
MRRTSSMSLQGLESLRELDLSANNFFELNASSFKGLSALHTLSLSQLHNLRLIQMNAFSGLPALQFVNLSSCAALEKIDDGAFGIVENLRVLDLSWCKLRRIPPNLVQWSRLKSLHLSGNLLHCDCEQLSFLPELARSLNLTDVMCTTPEDLSLKLIAELPPTCSTLSESEVSLIVVVSLLAIVSILLLIGFFLRRRINCCCSTNKSGAPLYGRSLLVSSTGYDKTDLLSDKTFYSTANRNSNRDSASRLTSLNDDEGGYYSSMLLPEVYPPQLYSASRPYLYGQTPEYCPIPPSAATIPSPPLLTDEDCSSENKCNFKIISEYPIPITEL